MHFLHPVYDNFFVIGMVEPASGVFWMMDLQAQVAARFIAAQTQNPAAADRLRRIKAGPEPEIRARIRYLDTPRHYLEVDHWRYRRALRNLLKRLPETLSPG
jgi:hypothetical protein